MTHQSWTVLDEFRDAGALLEGHFILSSGRHSAQFLQKNIIFMQPKRTERVCKALAELILSHFQGEMRPNVIVAPAVGGIIPGYETARHVDCLAMFVERENGVFALRRGFTLTPQDRVVIVEDIVTTGLSSRETLQTLAPTGASVLAVACLIDRSGGNANVGVPLLSLAQVNIPSYAPDDLPPELAALPAVKPGSRHLSPVTEK